MRNKNTWFPDSRQFRTRYVSTTSNRIQYDLSKLNILDSKVSSVKIIHAHGLETKKHEQDLLQHVSEKVINFASTNT